MGVRDRLESEVARLGITNVADKLGVARNTVYGWLAKANTPLNMLLGLQEMGADMRYVLFDERSSWKGGQGQSQTQVAEERLIYSALGQLTSEEKELLSNFRGCSEAVRAAMLLTSRELAEAASRRQASDK